MKGVPMLLVALSGIVFPSGVLGQTAIRTGEKTTGLTKQCFYNFAGSIYIRTLKSSEVCPGTIQVGNEAAGQARPQPQPQPGVQGATPFTDLGNAIASFLQGYSATRDARAREDEQLVGVAALLLDFAFQPENVQQQRLSLLLPAQLETVLRASQQVRSRLTLRDQQTLALLRLEAEIAAWLRL